MPSSFCMSIHFLDGTFHGRRDGGEPEWPPSPMRLFQAIVAAASQRWRDGEFSERVAPALRWLELQSPPVVVAPPTTTGAAYRLSVPNNAMDIVARAWVRGNIHGDGDANPATHRAMKTVRPTRLVDGDTIHYLWELPESAPNEVLGYVETLSVAARGVVALGWGIDLVAGSARVMSQDEANTLSGERWLPCGGADAAGLRLPRQGTLAALVERHATFLNRLPPKGGFNPVPPLSAFSVVGYRRSTDPPERQFAAFQLLKPDASSMRAFGVTRNLRRVVGMMRDATRRAAETAGWPAEKLDAFVMGHGEARGERHRPVSVGRFAYIPVPSIEGRGGKARVVGAVRRILVTSLDGGCESELAWAQRALSGSELINENNQQPEAILSLIAKSDRVLRDYAPSQPASTWATVTPMVLPGYDDRHATKAEELIRKAIRQAGFSDTLATHAVLDWRKVGFWPGTDLAIRYAVPEYLRNYPRYHVRIQWCDARGMPIAIRGPICMGGGRFCGLGLFAALAE